MRSIKWAAQFRRDFKRVKRGAHVEALELPVAAWLPARYVGHPMKGGYSDRRDCHLRPGPRARVPQARVRRSGTRPHRFPRAARAVTHGRLLRSLFGERSLRAGLSCFAPSLGEAESRPFRASIPIAGAPPAVPQVARGHGAAQARPVACSSVPTSASPRPRARTTRATSARGSRSSRTSRGRCSTPRRSHSRRSSSCTRCTTRTSPPANDRVAPAVLR